MIYFLLKLNPIEISKRKHRTLIKVKIPKIMLKDHVRFQNDMLKDQLISGLRLFILLKTERSRANNNLHGIF